MKIVYQPNCYSQQRQHEKRANIYPVLLAMEAEYYRQQGHTVIWDRVAEYDDRFITEPEGLPFLDLPAPDRVFTRAKEYTSGNYKYMPGTHIMAASGCWWGKCTFCVEKDKPYEVRPVDDVIAEIKECQRLGFREIFDDSDTFPDGSWREEFCRKLKPLNIPFSCNMRFGTLQGTDYIYLKKAGFRMLLYGLESANQETLDRINKGIVERGAAYELMLASRYGLEPHVAYMVSYPWETLEEEMNTIKLVQWLLKKGYAKTAQCSVYCPPDGKAWREREYLTKKLYNVAFMPEFWYNKFKDLKSFDDWRYLLRGIKEGVSAKWASR